MGICHGNINKSKPKQQVSPHQCSQTPPSRIPKYSIRSPNEPDQHSTNLTNLTNITNIDMGEKAVINHFKTKDQERDLVLKLIESPVKTHLIEFKWAYQYTNYLKDENEQPGEINNDILIDKLRTCKELIPDKDYVLVHCEVWNMLVNIYKGGPALTLNDLAERKSENILDHSLRVFASHSVNELDNKLYRQLKSIPAKEIQIVGLENDIYFCYLNSVIQCLMGISQLNYYFLYTDLPEKKIFLNSYQTLIRRINKCHYKQIIVAKELIRLLQKHFSIYEMHDSSELFLYLLDKFKEECKSKQQQSVQIQEDYMQNHLGYWQQNSTIIDELFGGQLTSFIKCPNCAKLSTQHDPFFDLSLSLPEKGFMQKKLHLTDCLENYFKEEIIEGIWTCSECEHKTKDIKRRVKITFAPNILVIQLKRFSTYPLKKKIKEPVQIDIELNLKHCCVSDIQDTKYRLKSMIVHSGNIDQGHYVAVVKRQQNFYLFNDDEIDKLPNENISRIDSAYLLMYQR